MSIIYKTDIMAALKEAGYSSTRLRVEKYLGESYMTQLRRGDLVSWAAIDTICNLLDCQPGDILAYVPDQPEKKS
jgi:putative transcriptional regulator